MDDLTDTSNVPEKGGETAVDGEKPDFEDWEDPEQLFGGQSTRERMMDVVVQLHEPTKVSIVAERAGCDTETARNYLSWFADLGLVREHGGRPVRYERNESFLRWRRVERIREQYSEEEIVNELGEVLQAIEEYRDQFGADTPGQVSLKEASRDTTVEDAWEALSEWQTLERRAELLDEARRDAYSTSGGFGRINV